jgi:dTDP-4-dehydrorhamnose 3,5-epimerase
MRFVPTKLSGVFEIHLQPNLDQRGFFARTWCRREFQDNGLNSNIAQCSVSFNISKGTLRGIHYQDPPYQEAKLVRCTKGSIYDVAVDLRLSSPTFKQWVGVNLSSENGVMLYVPEGCGHGFLTLTSESEVFYQISEFYNSDHSRGVRWDDPVFGIQWPDRVEVISERDRNYPNFNQ